MKAVILFVILLIAGNSFADIEMDGLIIQDARLSFSESSRVKKGDFEGNGGDGLRLRYGIKYNHLLKLNPANVVGVLPPSAILNYDIGTGPVKILLTNNAIYIPSIFYFNRNDIKNVVRTMFSVQRMKHNHFDSSGGADGSFNDPLWKLDNSMAPAGVIDFEQRLSHVLSDMALFLEHGTLKKDERVKSLGLMDFQLVDEDLFDRFGTRVCGIYAQKYKVKIDISCWGRMSVLEQRLLAAHEIFRILNIDDDDYAFTYQFLNFKDYSETNSFFLLN